MKAKYIVMIGLFAASFAACSRDEESLFDKPAAQRAQEAVTSALDVLSSNEAGWEMAYFPNLEADAKGYNMVLKFNKNGNVSVTAKNATTTGNKIITDTASTWAVKSDYGPLLTFDTYNDVFHAFSDPKEDGAGLLGDYEFLILKATPELVLLKGKKHSAYSVMRPVKNPDVAAYFAACEKMQADLFGNNNIVTLHQDGKKMYLYNGAEGQFQSAAYGSQLIAESATYHPVCATEDGIIVSTGFGEDVHDHIFYYNAAKGELKSEAGAVMNAGNLNLLFKSYFSDNLSGWAIDTTGIESVAPFLDQINTFAKDPKKSTNIKVMGYGYKQSLNMYEGGYFILVKVGYKQEGKGKEKEAKLLWTVDIDVTENGIEVYNAVPNDATTETWIKNAPAIQGIIDAFLGTFTTESGNNLFNGAAGMKLVGPTQELLVSGSSLIKM